FEIDNTVRWISLRPFDELPKFGGIAQREVAPLVRGSDRLHAVRDHRVERRVRIRARRDMVALPLGRMTWIEFCEGLIELGVDRFRASSSGLQGFRKRFAHTRIGLKRRVDSRTEHRWLLRIRLRLRLPGHTRLHLCLPSPDSESAYKDAAGLPNTLAAVLVHR